MPFFDQAVDIYNCFQQHVLSREEQLLGIHYDEGH